MSLTTTSTFDQCAEPARALPHLVELLRWRAQTQPGRLAFTFLPEGEGAEEHLSYAELDRRARSVAALLMSRGAAGERVLLLLPPGLDYIAAFWGCLYAGAVAVPAYPPRMNRNLLRLQAVVSDARAAFALTSDTILARLRPLLAGAPELSAVRWLCTDEAADELSAQWRQPEIDPDALAFLQYTSGSTAAPKGVMVTHANLLHNQAMIARAFGQSADSVIVGWLPLYHDMGLIGNMLQPLYVGGRCVLMSPVAFLQKPSRWLQAITRYRATTSGGPNFAYELCVRKIDEAERAELELSSWDVAFNGAETVRAETLERFAEAFAGCGFRRRAFFPCYGLAEATLLVTAGGGTEGALLKSVESGALERHRVAAADGQSGTSRLVGCGRPTDEQQVVIVNPETLTRCAPDEVGEVWVGGPSIAAGYWGREELTAQTFGAYLTDTSEGPFLRTGDLGFLGDGELFITGRLKDLIIIRGRNLYPQDIERSVGESHAALRAGSGVAFSVGVAGEERLVVVQEVGRRASSKDADEIIENIRQVLAEEYDVAPYAVQLVKTGAVPKTSSGKLQRRASREQFLRGDFEVVAEWRAGASEGTGSVRPAGETFGPWRDSEGAPSSEEIIAWLRGEVAARLGVAASAIEDAQPLTRYGLDSLVTVELMHSIETNTGVALPPALLFQTPSLRELTAYIQEQTALAREQAETQQAVAATDGAPTPAAAEFASSEAVEYPLSHGQQALWFLQRVSPESAHLNVATALLVPRALDAAALRRAFDSLVLRHEALRTTFTTTAQGEPRQRIHTSAALDFESAECADEGALQERLESEAGRPFDLERDALLRVRLLRAADRRVLLVVAHHIVVDFWSLAVLLEDLGRLYAAELKGAAAEMPSAGWQYRDYVRRQREMLEGEEGERLAAYWAGQMQGELPTLKLPFARTPAPAALTTAPAAAHIFRLDADLTRRLRELARRHDATLYVVLLAAYELLLARYTGQEELLVGVPMAGRTGAALSRTVGYFVNPVALRARVGGGETFTELLEQVRQALLGAMAHQEYPFPLLVQRVQPEREAGGMPLLQTVFVLQQSQSSEGEGLAALALGAGGVRVGAGGLELETVAVGRRGGQFELTVMLAESAAGLLGAWEYDATVYAEEDVRRMAECFEVLLRDIVAEPGQVVSRLRLMGDGERRRLLAELSTTAGDAAPDRLTHRLFEQRAADAPHAPAVECGGASLTYAELNRRANQLARHLRALGVSVEEPVAILLERSAEMVVAQLAVLKAGGAYVPLDRNYPPERLAFMLADSGARVLLTQSRLASLVPQEAVDGALRVVALDADAALFSRQSEDDITDDAVTAENLAYIIYTSGSTGRPKGVAVSHGALLNLIGWHRSAFAVNASDRATLLAGVGFDASVWELWPYLTCGASLHVPDEQTRAVAPRLRDWLISERVSVSFLPTPLAEQVLTLEWPADCALRLLLTGGDKLHAYPPAGLPFDVVNNYGPTENAVVATSVNLASLGDREGAPPIGRPVSNTQLYVLDRAGQLAPAGVAGELYIGGRSLARGYHGQADLTAERFVPHPFSTEAGARLYRTGDAGRYRADGQIEFLGRLDHQVKVRGHRIELGEIEVVLARHAAVGEVVVSAQAEEGGARLVAYFVEAAGQSTTTAALRSYLKQHLPEFMVPSVFVRLVEMPLTPNGKVDRRALPPPPSVEAQPERAHTAARTPLEQLLCTIWADLLGHERVGVHDDFFDLGGHSLLAAQAVSRIQQACAVDLPLRDLFEHPTVEQLAARLAPLMAEAKEPHAPSPIERLSRDYALPLSSAQRRLWFLDQLEPDSPLYNIAAAVRLRGALDLGALEQSLRHIIERHESLRTSFAVLDGEPVQLIAPLVSWSLPVVELGHLPQPEREAEARRLMSEEARRPFALTDSPLLRATLLRLTDDEQILLLVMHHIISDGWSMGLFVRELSALYNAFLRPGPADDEAATAELLPPLSIQYADYASWQRQHSSAATLEPQLNYWRKQLGGQLPVLELPAKARPPVATHRGATVTKTLERQLSARLVELGQSHGATLYVTLLAAFNTLLWRYTGQTDLLVGTPVAGRNRLETEELIGLFVNTLVLRTDISGDPTFGELLGRVRETALEAQAHQDVPFEMLVEELQPERDLSRPPLFQVMLVVENIALTELQLEGVVSEELSVDSGTAKFDLTLFAREVKERLVLCAEYSTDLFEEAQVERLLEHYTRLLEGAVAEPERRVSELEMLSEGERHQVVHEWNDEMARAYPAASCLHELFEQQVARTPLAVALRFEAQELTYADLDARANRLAHHLRSLGVGPEVLVGVLLERSPEMVVS
ncbi:MAG TPA: amino acid adenylation domain-containing protein, partial [Pyrinomonadaceae bacterium]|nr:amino acid adenylation domain-containing protein [Pyrinomonadaceae bacterium]